MMALACMATFSLIAASMLHGAILARSFIHSEHHARQASLLLDATCHQVAARLAEGGSLAEERLVIPSEEICGKGNAKLIFNDKPSDTGEHQIRVTVEYPFEGQRPVRCSRDIVFNTSRTTTKAHTTNNR